MSSGNDPSSLHPYDPAVEIAAKDLAHSALAGPVPAGGGDAEAVAAVSSYAETLADPSDSQPILLDRGVYQDGVLQPEGTQIDFPQPPENQPSDTYQNGLVTQALIAETGANTALNAAAVFDEHNTAGALLVIGNDYAIDAIVQVDILVSNATVAAAAAWGSLSSDSSGNAAHNTAGVFQHDLRSGPLGQGMTGGTLSIDRIEGHFYNVSNVTQWNAIADNDVAVQAQFGSYYIVTTGENGATNVFTLSTIGSHYDAIVVLGDHYSANIIIQCNILVNDDYVASYSVRSNGASLTVETGQNELENIASIDRYGNSATEPLNPVLAHALGDLRDGALDPGLASVVPTAGGQTVHVLMITGDYFDINVISQTNIVYDNDTVVQYSPEGAGAKPAGESSSMQSASTGGNSLSNFAQIVDVNPVGPTYVGGEHYGQAMLVQASFVTDQSVATTGETQDLAAQVGAATGLPVFAVDLQAEPATTSTIHQQEDLFHGVLT